MAVTSIPAGHPTARKLYSVALFAAFLRRPSFANSLTGAAPKQGDAESKLKGQSSPDMPFVRATDLSKTAGDTVSVDLYHMLQAMPIMGGAMAEGRGTPLSSASMDISINQFRFPVSAGDTMSQQRTVHSLRGIAMANTYDLVRRYIDQLSLVHVAGGRGSQNTVDWVIPVQFSSGTTAHPDFASITINTVKAPTYNRHYVVNGTGLTQGGAQLASIATTDDMQLEHIDAIATLIADSAFQLQPVQVADDPAAKDEPMYVLYLTERQWNTIQTNTSGQVWRTFLQNAWNRASYGSKHPLFKGEPGMWRNILVRKTSRAIRFLASENARTNPSTNVETNTTVASGLSTTHAADRALLMGAQALVQAYGRAQNSDFYFGWSEKELDHGDKLEVLAKGMCGFSKTRFDYPTTSGVEATDHGVYVIDSAVPL